MSECALELAPAVAGASLLQSGALEGIVKGASKVVQRCAGNPRTRPDPATRLALDDKVMCAVMCCCKDNPGIGIDGRSLQQSCADKVFKTADALLGNKSRYKSEISYDMHLDEGGAPTPFMHRDKGADTTQPSTYWQGRAKEEIENYARGQGMVRRPDVTIVDDPCLPPVGGNIERVAEMKFGVDRRDELQDRAYARIAGGEEKYQVFRCGGRPFKDEHACDCNDKGLRDSVRVLAPKPEEMTEKQRQQLRDLAKAGVAITGLAAAAALLVRAAALLWPVLLAL